MRQDLRMRYKKVLPISWTGNSTRNLILRQQFALAFLKVDLSKKVILNIDEVGDLESYSNSLFIVV
jgi:hypothetical protein